ncbi:MAG: sugar ABC transporter permease [Devosia sp.]
MSRSFKAYALIFPGFFVSALIILWPLITLVQLSMAQVNRFGQIKGFAGLQNYLVVFQDPLLYASLLRTLVWTGGVVGGTLLLSLPVALLMHQRFYGRGLARVLIMLPWAISLAMLALVGRWMLNGESGMVNSALSYFGLIHGNIAWLGQASTAFPAQILIGIVASYPFTVSVYLGGLSSVPTELYEAARLEGSSPLQTFWRITVPLLKPFINIAVVLNTIYVFNSFPIIWATTEGGPANSTDILVTYLYKLAFRFGKVGEAAVLSLVMFLVLLAFTLIYLRISSTERRAS